MRKNNRDKILDAAVRIVQRDGADRLTLEATAEEAGVTRGGMTYHFRDRAALGLALQQHLAAGWERGLVEAADKEAVQATAAEKAAAYLRVATTAATSGELELILRGSHDPELNDAWRQVQERWSPSPTEALSDPVAMRYFLVRLLSDGLWVYDSLAGQQLAPEVRQAITEQALGFVSDVAASSAPS